MKELRSQGENEVDGESLNRKYGGFECLLGWWELGLTAVWLVPGAWEASASRLCCCRSRRHVQRSGVVAETVTGEEVQPWA